MFNIIVEKFQLTGTKTQIRFCFLIYNMMKLKHSLLYEDWEV